MVDKPDGILVLTFGGPEGPDDVMPFLRNVTAGRGVPDARLAVVADQYALFGGRSPINDQSRLLVTSLRKELVDNRIDLPVYWGTRNWNPRLTDTVSQMRDDGVRNAFVFTNSAFSSYPGCRQYQEDLAEAVVELREASSDQSLPFPHFQFHRPYFNHPGFIEPMAQSTMMAITEHGSASESHPAPEDVHLIFTAHSLPQEMAKACDYEVQLREAVDLVVDRLGPHHPTRVDLVFQSRSGAPGSPWLGPDILEHLNALATESKQSKSGYGGPPVTLVPIGFTSDHMEVLYDLDIQAANRAKELGIPLTRAKTVGSSHLFIKMIRELIEEELIGAKRFALGSMGPLVAHDDDQHCLPSAGSSS